MPSPGQENLKQGFDYNLQPSALCLIILFLLPRTPCVALPELQADWIRNKLFLFGTIVVIVCLELDAYRAADYSTTSLKLMPSHSCSGLNTSCPCLGLL